MVPSDLSIDPGTATRDWLSAKSIGDLVTASGGLYVPPAKFRPAAVAHR
jgi:malonate decarboxylase alpha subunit